MANLTPVNSNDPVVQLELDTFVLGGPGQIMNAQAQALLNRLTYETNRATAAEATKAPINSPAFTGTPTAPTAGSGDSSTQIATTAFISNLLAAGTPIANMNTNSYTFVSGDLGHMLLDNTAGTTTATVPSSLGSVGQSIDVLQYSTGSCTIVAGGGVTIHVLNNNYALAGQYAAATLVKVEAPDTWLLIGNLTT